MPPDIDHEWTCNPVCPYCAKEDSDWWDGVNEKELDQGEWETMCSWCNRQYAVMLTILHRFATEKAGGE